MVKLTDVAGKMQILSTSPTSYYPHLTEDLAFEELSLLGPECSMLLEKDVGGYSIFIKTLTGKTVELTNVNWNHTLDAIKTMIQDAEVEFFDDDNYDDYDADLHIQEINQRFLQFAGPLLVNAALVERYKRHHRNIDAALFDIPEGEHVEADY